MDIVTQGAAAAKLIVDQGVTAAMNKLNKRNVVELDGHGENK